ncbi:MAG: PorV/PorQ family protein [Bacteroidota bacterium]|nr:PorV/PorQ family protein [Bacteroidota bacterium]
MKAIYKYFIAALLTGLFIFPANQALAGNKDRSGEAGAGELLINPWARSSGWGSVSTANVRGLEGMFVNVAGLAFTQGTEVVFSSTQWLKGTDTDIMSFGLAQKVGESGVLGLYMSNMSFGDIDITTEDIPEGNIGTFSPNLMTIGVSYSKIFSNSIYGGIIFKLISESMSDVTANGVAIDAGIQYVAGEEENITFGITLKNWGPTMSFSGDGLSIRAFLPGEESMFTLGQRNQEFELPSQLNIGAAYDFLFDKHTVTLAGNFRSNSFTNDQITAGIQYKLMNYLMLRGAYTYEEGLDEEITSGNRYNVDNGLSAGLSIQVPLSKEEGSVLSIDYAFRSTVHFDNTHSIGASIKF